MGQIPEYAAFGESHEPKESEALAQVRRHFEQIEKHQAAIEEEKAKINEVEAKLRHDYEEVGAYIHDRLKALA